MIKRISFFGVLFVLFTFFTASLTQAATSTCGEQLADVVIMLDASKSIDLTTELPYEAAAAKGLLDTFITLGLENKVAIGAFSGTAAILPGGNLSTDYAALKTVIDTHFTDTSAGTNLEDAIQKSETELNTGSNPLKFIILISDGLATKNNTTTLSNHEAALQAAQTAKNNGIRIITIAYDATDGSNLAIIGRAALSAMASNGSVDNTSGDIDVTERDLENSDGDDFFVAPNITDLSGICNGISDTISCDDADTCTLDICDETTRVCSYSNIDYDADTTPDCRDTCPNDPLKTEAGQCGCNALDTDDDADGVANCLDLCPVDPNKLIPGACGCGALDTDTDGDGIADCLDVCSSDPLNADSDGDGVMDCLDLCPTDGNKTLPGQCGCSVEDSDSDFDGTPNCLDLCATDPSKTTPGACGCEIADADSDGDETLNCNDQCPSDANKIIPGVCGCGALDTDTDGDGTADCQDLCALDLAKTLPGTCGCGVQDTDRDGDSIPDCDDVCASDPNKITTGICGCNVSDVDSDGDGTADCDDVCASDPNKITVGSCGCGTSDIDTDNDGVVSCFDACPSDVNKTEAGLCGCGTADTDTDGDGLANCVDQCPSNPDVTKQSNCDNTEPADVITPNPSAAGAVCDVTLDANADGLPDDLDTTLDDANADGIPDCCTSGNADADLLNYDSDGDALPDCREFAIGTNPVVNDLSPQGSATTFSFGNCSLDPNATKSTGAKAELFALAFIMLALWRLRVRADLKSAPVGAILILIILLGLARPAQALNVQSFFPADAVGSGFGLYTSQSLAPGQVATGVFFNYAEHPFELGRINNDPRILGIVDRLITADVVATVGLFKHVNFSVNVPVNLYHDIAPTFIATRDRGGPDLGDLRLSTKLQALDADSSSGHWGLALVPFVTIPTGEESIYLSDDGSTGGAIVVGEKKFGADRLYVNAGAEFRKKQSLGNFVSDDDFTYGVGYQHQLSEAHAISGIVELQGSTTFRKFFNDEVSSPLEGRAVVQKDFLQERNLHSYLGVGMGLTNGVSAPDVRVHTGVSYAFNLQPDKKAVKPTQKPAMFVEVVYFPNDKDQFYQESWTNIQKAVQFWKAHPQTSVLLAGYTDSNADDAYNRALSTRRAKRVMNVLVKQGVAQDQIEMRYFGEENPVATNDTAEGRQRNRRTEIQILLIKK